MSKEEKNKIKRELILWYETGEDEKVGNALKKLILKERQIIEYRYKDGMYWDFIAEKTEYSYTHCFRIHNKAMEILWEILKDN